MTRWWRKQSAEPMSVGDLNPDDPNPVTLTLVIISLTLAQCRFIKAHNVRSENMD
jgi:hypothetical protein